MGRGTFEGDVPAHYNVPKIECIPYSLPATAGEYACPAQAANECICWREAWLDSNVAFRQITLNTCWLFIHDHYWFRL